MVNHNIPPSPGTYVLILHLAEDRTITVGQLGEIPFRPGYYLYIGSARGPGGLRARIDRHLRRKKPAHWHVDYLRRWARPVEVWFVVGSNRLECRWRRALQEEAGLPIAVDGFGASDCRCPAHLLYSADWPSPSLRYYLERSAGRSSRQEALSACS